MPCQHRLSSCPPAFPTLLSPWEENPERKGIGRRILGRSPHILAIANDAGAKGAAFIGKLFLNHQFRKPKAMLPMGVCVSFSVHLGWASLSEKVTHSGGLFQAETFEVSYKWIYCSHHNKDPFNTQCPQHQISSPRPQLHPSPDSC